MLLILSMCSLSVSVCMSNVFVKTVYRKPPNISLGLIFVCKHFLVGLYMGGGAYIREGLYTDRILC